MLEQQIAEWMHKVLAAQETPGATDTYQMMVDIDRIISEAFCQDPVMPENP